MKLCHKDLKRVLIKKCQTVKPNLDILKHDEIVKEKMFLATTEHFKIPKAKLIRLHIMNKSTKKNKIASHIKVEVIIHE